MSASRIEQTRLLHEDVETQVTKIVDEMLIESSSNKAHILKDHAVAMRLRKLRESAKQILEVYEDADGIRSKELEDISGENVFSVFYDRLKDIRDYHRKFPNSNIVTQGGHDIKPKVKFTGQEAFGRFLDLNPIYEKYINLPVVSERCDFLTFLDRVDKFEEIPQDKKIGTANYTPYKAYLDELLQYFVSVQERLQPLVETQELMGIIDSEFAKDWKSEKIVGWFGADDTKENPEDNPLYCRACEKVFSKHTTFSSHLKGRKHKRNAEQLHSAGKGGKGGKMKKELDNRKVQLAKLEFRIKAYGGMLKDRLEATKVYVERKQTRTLDEIAADLEEQEEDLDSDSDEDEEDKPIYNPLNLPLGWDDKPIPFWLYKLHGLNHKFECEICGGYAYWGPRAFQRHFTEWRHTYGMRCMGIPMSKHFINIVKFDDAIALHEKLSKRDANSGWNQDEEEEFEDDDGNVWNKKTFERLQRQGIIRPSESS